MSQKRIRYNSYGIPIPPKSYLTESILATLFCCLPLGVIGIISASKVESLYNQGRYAEAEYASADARRWTRYSFVTAIVCWIIVVLINFILPFLYVLFIGGLLAVEGANKT